MTQDYTIQIKQYDKWRYLRDEGYITEKDFQDYCMTCIGQMMRDINIEERA